MVTKRIAMVGVAAVIAGLGLCGCSGIQQLVGGLQQQGQEPQQQQAPQDNQLNENAGAEVVTENDDVDENVADEEVTPQPSADVSDAVDASKTTDENPIPFGQWGKVSIYATGDKAYHDVNVRITDVITQSENSGAIDDAIAEHNELSTEWNTIDVDDLGLPDDVEMCLVRYEVNVPSDFPEREEIGGINRPELQLEESAIGGGGFDSNDDSSVYIGLGANNEVLSTKENNDDMDFEAGKTYEFVDLFFMVKGADNYVFETTGYPDGTPSDDTSADIMYHAYFAAK